MSTKQREKRVEKAQMGVLFTVPFFAPGVAKLPVEFTDDPRIDTAATDGKKILWNAEWFDKLTDPQVVTVLCHEVCHCMLGHGWRAPAGADWDLWNQATDHAVNLMLKEFSEQVMGKRLADPFPFPDPQDAYCADPKFKGFAEEVIYVLLNNANRPKMPQNAPGGRKAPGAGSGKAGGGKAQQAQGKSQPGSMPSFGQILKPENGSGSMESKKLRNDWDHALVQAVTMSKGRGELPGSMARYVDELLNPQVPWWELVRQWLREQASDDWSWKRGNPYYDDSGFILPSLDSERMGPIVFATDTSGSIDQECLRHFQAEKQNCLDDLKPSRLVDICCDSKIQQVKEYRVGDEIDRRAPGGGGTDFKPVFEHVGQFQEVPKCLVYLTDLYGSFPDTEPGYPVLWVSWSGGKAPFGEVIKV